ncbi:tyrosine-type recombinase/integrase [Neomoorella thermoacetica]|uniref:tyrosine-type recombinase/integrase n=1 Tax=Neomoorella thermoacetica TaxID=1525 RepID=UPI0008FB1700|nr:site-specific integrase [Moorella thermoacetica]APC09052.1 putative prophage phiRv2 integrase [Moorella thermoacetica]OIQ55001.1 transposase from transposon Tn916 [Moorella thermoacetica]
MASISKPLGTDKHGIKIYQVSWREPNGKQRHKRVHGYEEAKKFAAKIELKLANGQYKNLNNITLGEYILRWIEEQETKRYMTREEYTLIATKHIMPQLGNIKLSDLRPFHIKEYLIFKLKNGRLDGKPGGLDKNTVKKHRRILHLILQCAYEDELIQENPVDRVNTKKIIPPSNEDKKEKIALTREQVNELLRLAENTELYLPIMIAVWTGLRRGEVLGLKWKNVDLDNRIIYVNETLQRQKKDEIPEDPSIPKTELKFDEPPKSKNSKLKPVVIPKVLVTQLRLEKKKQAAQKLLWGPAYQENGLVCCQENGKPHDPANFSNKFRAFIDKKTNLPKISFHNLRHTYVTIMAEETNVGINTVADLARHADPGFTARVYVHPNMQMYYQAVDRYEAYILSGNQKENQPSREAGQD